MPQKDLKSYRSDEDNRIFSKGIKQMGTFTSIRCTQVLQLKLANEQQRTMPKAADDPMPLSMLDDVLTLFDVPSTSSLQHALGGEKRTVDQLEDLLAKQLQDLVEPHKILSVEREVIEVFSQKNKLETTTRRVRFASAEAAKAALKLMTNNHTTRRAILAVVRSWRLGRLLQRSGTITAAGRPLRRAWRARSSRTSTPSMTSS